MMKREGNDDMLCKSCTPSSSSSKAERPWYLKGDCPKLRYKMRFKDDEGIAVKTLSLDEETKIFLNGCKGSIWNELMYHIGIVLERCFSKTDVNGFLGRGSMHVISTAQAKILLGGLSNGSLLDIGAGDGNVTQNLAPLFRRVVTTEVSVPMCKRLRDRGWECINTELPTAASLKHEKFDYVSLCNVLDRCDRPRTLLQQIRQQMLVKGGRLLLAVVLPFCPFVERGAKKVSPKELLPLRGGLCPCSLPPLASRRYPRFETCVSHMIRDVFIPAGYDVESVSRVPYLSKGGRYNNPFYVLQDAVFVLKSSERQCDITMQGDS